MTQPKPANLVHSVSAAEFVSAPAQIGAEVDHQPLRSSALARIMREMFHGSDACGAWDWRMAYGGGRARSQDAGALHFFRASPNITKMETGHAIQRAIDHIKLVRWKE